MRISFLLLFFILANPLFAIDTVKVHLNCEGNIDKRDNELLKNDLIVRRNSPSEHPIYLNAKDSSLASIIIMEINLCEENWSNTTIKSYHLSILEILDGTVKAVKNLSVNNRNGKYGTENQYTNWIVNTESNISNQLIYDLDSNNSTYSFVKQVYSNKGMNVLKMITNSSGDTSEIEIFNVKEKLSYTREIKRFVDNKMISCQLEFHEGKLKNITGDQLVFIDDHQNIISKEKFIEIANLKGKPMIDSGEIHYHYFRFPVYAKEIRPELMVKESLRNSNSYNFVLCFNGQESISINKIVLKKLELDDK
jgi:hypothetical protein